MKAKISLLCLLFSFFLQSTFAHLYYAKDFPFEGTKPDLDRLLPDSISSAPFWSNPGNPGYFFRYRKTLLKEGHPESDFRFQSDLAFCEYILGDNNALSTMEKLYQAYPGEFNIAFNLSMIEESRGNHVRSKALAEQAYRNFAEAFHHSTELHIRIQQFHLNEITGIQNITGLNTGDSLENWLSRKNGFSSGKSDSLLVQLCYLIHFRTAIFDASNAVTSQLIVDFADLLARTSTRTIARPFYGFALSFNPENENFITQRLELMNASEEEVSSTFQWASLVWAIPIILILVAFIGNMMNRKKKGITSESGRAQGGD